MATIILPGGITPKFVSGSMEIVRADGVLEMFNGATQITSFNKAVWVASFTPPPVLGAAFAAWRAALVQLSSQANDFELQPFEYSGPSTGYAGAAPLVQGAAQLGKTLIVDGVTASTAIAKAGDYFSVFAIDHNELKLLTSDATSDATGKVTLTFEPALRKSPADNAVVEIVAPKTSFMLANPRIAWSLSLLKIGRIKIDAIEAFGP